MNDDEHTLKRLRDVIGRVSMVDPSSICDNARLLGFGIDSIRVIDLVMSIEEEFSIRLEPEQLFGVATVQDLAEHVNALRALSAPRAAKQDFV